MRLMYYEFGFCLLLLLLVLIYFPHKPPKPPSVSASIQRVDFKWVRLHCVVNRKAKEFWLDQSENKRAHQVTFLFTIDCRRGVIDLFKHPKFWMLGIPYAVPDGFLNCWLTVLDVNVKPLGVSQDTAGESRLWTQRILLVSSVVSIFLCNRSYIAWVLLCFLFPGWMGFFASLAGNVLGVIVAFFSDIFKRRMKLLVIVLYVISAGWYSTSKSCVVLCCAKAILKIMDHPALEKSETRKFEVLSTRLLFQLLLQCLPWSTSK